MAKCPQCGKKTNRQNPLGKEWQTKEKICRKCRSSNYVRRVISGAPT